MSTSLDINCHGFRPTQQVFITTTKNKEPIEQTVVFTNAQGICLFDARDKGTSFYPWSSVTGVHSWESSPWIAESESYFPGLAAHTEQASA